MPVPLPLATKLAIQLFGPLSVQVDGEPMPKLRSRKGLWLLALLVLRHGKDVQRSWLAATLWPDNMEEQAFASLRQSLSDLRGALGSQGYRLISPTPPTIRLDLSDANVDLIQFDMALASSEVKVIESAIPLYKGHLLEGCVEEWVYQERIVREQQFLQAIEQVAAAKLSAARMRRRLRCCAEPSWPTR